MVTLLTDDQLDRTDNELNYGQWSLPCVSRPPLIELSVSLFQDGACDSKWPRAGVERWPSGTGNYRVVLESVETRPCNLSPILLTDWLDATRFLHLLMLDEFTPTYNRGSRISPPYFTPTQSRSGISPPYLHPTFCRGQKAFNHTH